MKWSCLFADEDCLTRQTNYALFTLLNSWHIFNPFVCSNGSNFTMLSLIITQRSSLWWLLNAYHHRILCRNLTVFDVTTCYWITESRIDNTNYQWARQTSQQQRVVSNSNHWSKPFIFEIWSFWCRRIFAHDLQSANAYSKSAIYSQRSRTKHFFRESCSMDTGEERCINTQFSNHLKDIFDTKYKTRPGHYHIHLRQKYLLKQFWWQQTINLF